MDDQGQPDIRTPHVLRLEGKDYVLIDEYLRLSQRYRDFYSSRWFLVSEQLPELLTEVLGWHQDDQVRAWFRFSGTVQGGPKQGKYWEMWSPQDRECDDCKVNAPTHWMPMPRPPEVK
jgi:hypothetical protein